MIVVVGGGGGAVVVSDDEGPLNEMMFCLFRLLFTILAPGNIAPLATMVVVQ
jgi:hypothetical protein